MVAAVITFDKQIDITRITPANTKRSTDAGTMLAQRRRRWANIVPKLAERFEFCWATPLPVIVSHLVLICAESISLINVVENYYIS